MTTKPITVEMLEEHGACRLQKDLFRKKFPHGVVPIKDMSYAVWGAFDLEWAVATMFSEDARLVFCTARGAAGQVLDKALEPAEIAYQAAVTPARSAYFAVRASADNILYGENYMKVYAVAEKVYEEATAGARGVYRRAVWVAFVEAWELM